MLFFRQALEFARLTPQISDIYFSVNKPVRFRMGDQLPRFEQHVEPLSEEDVHAIIRTVVRDKEHLDYLEKYKVLDVAYTEGELGKFRVHVARQRGQCDVTIRVLNDHIQTIDELNLPEILKNINDFSWGLIVVSGLYASGKTTSLLSMIEYLNSLGRPRTIITIESPREAFLTDKKCIIKQKELLTDVLSYSSYHDERGTLIMGGIESSLRETCDVLVVGEAKDPKTIKDVISASGTCLVLTTTHGVSAVETINRLINSAPTSEQEEARIALASNLRAIICQRLVTTAEGVKYPAVEILTNNSTIAGWIRNRELTKIEEYLIDVSPETEGTKPTFGQMHMHDSLHTLFKKGIITRTEAIERATNPHDMEAILNGVFTGSKSAFMQVGSGSREFDAEEAGESWERNQPSASRRRRSVPA